MACSELRFFRDAGQSCFFLTSKDAAARITEGILNNDDQTAIIVDHLPLMLAKAPYVEDSPFVSAFT